jgi:RimJ/RimL family protein N-acetyltransferase
MASPAVLEGEKVRLRPAGEADVDRLVGWYRDPERSSPFDRYGTESREELAASLRGAPGDPGSLAPRYVIERRSDGISVGCVGHYRAHPVLALLDVWYLVGEPSARGGGLGSEAVRLLTTHLFASTAYERVGATCDVENLPSARLLERIGFRREATLPSTLYHHGRWHDVAVYGVRRSEWRPTPARA